MKAREYLRRLRLSTCQEDVDEVVKAMFSDPDLTVNARGKLLIAVKKRRAQLPERI